MATRWFPLRRLPGTVLLLGLLIGALTFPAAAQKAVSTAASATASPSPSAQVFDGWAQLVESGDLATLMDRFTDDAVWMSPGEIVSGKEAIRLRIAGALAQTKATNGSLKIDHQQIAGPWANVAASFTATWTAPGGQQFTEQSRYVCVLRRDDGRPWRIWSFTFFPAAQ